MQAVSIVFLSEGCRQGLHRFRRGLVQGQRHIGHIHYHVKNGHIQVPIQQTPVPSPEQQTVGEEKECELEDMPYG